MGETEQAEARAQGDSRQEIERLVALAQQGDRDALEEFANTLTRRRVFGFLDVNFAGSGGVVTGDGLEGVFELAAARAWTAS